MTSQEIVCQNIAAFNELLNCINNVDHNLSIERIPDKVLLLMGETKAGKTTLLYYLLQRKLILQVNQLGVTHISPEAIYFEALIGNGYQSTTVYPNIPTDVDQDECLLIDMPGFNDTRSMYRFLNIYIIRSVFKNIKKIHVSFVLPFQSLEGDDLQTALQNTCPLFRTSFLRRQRSFSFILTKIEDQQSNKDTFRQQMQQLRQIEPQEQLSQVLKTFDKRNIYTFCNSQPNLLEGVELKKQIIRENEFYPIEQNYENILSENYADIIIGKGDRQEFNEYLQKIIEQLGIYLPQIINAFTWIVRYQYRQLLSQCSNYTFENHQFSQQIQKLKQIGLQVTPQWINPRESFQIEDTQTLLKSFVYKMRQNQVHRENQNQRIIQRIKKFVYYSKDLSQQPSGLSEQLRNTLKVKLKDCYILIQNLNSISSKLQIENSVHNFLRSQSLNNAIEFYFNFINDSTFLAKLMEIPQARLLLHLDQHFNAVITSYDPKYTPSASEVITKVVEEKSRDKLINKQFQKTFLETSKTIKPTTIEKPQLQVLLPSRGSQVQQLAQQIQKLPNNHYTLKMLLQSLKNMSKLTTVEQRNPKLLNTLLTKSLKLLSSLSLIEQAIIFSISIPDYNQTQQLVQVGMKFALITPEFIKTILLPYISFVEYDFQLVQKVYSFMITRVESFNQIQEMQQNYVVLMNKMRRNLSEDLFEYQSKRYDLQIIENLISGEESLWLLQRAEQRCENFRKNILCSNNGQRQLARLANIC